MSNEQLTVSLPVLSEKQLVKKSAITPAKAVLQLRQNGVTLFERSTEGLSLSESFATLSNIFHYQFKANRFRLDKYNVVSMTLTFGEAVYNVDIQPRTDKKGNEVVYTSNHIAGMLKNLYKGFAADILEAATLKGMYFNFIHASNTIARFTPSFNAANAKLEKAATKAAK